MSADPIVETTFTSTPRMIMRSYRACAPVTATLRWAAPVGFVGWGLASNDLVPIIAAVALFAFLTWQIRRQLAPMLDGPHELMATMTEDAYVVVSGDKVISRPWTTFSQVRLRAGFWVMKAGRGALALPADALDEQQTAAFVELLRRKGLSPQGVP